MGDLILDALPLLKYHLFALRYHFLTSQRQTSLPVTTSTDGRRRRRNCRRHLRQFDAFDVEETNLDLHRQKQLDVGDGFAAHHVASQQRVESVAPVVERLLLRRQEVERRAVGDD
jgi:hypothetical protein